MLEGLSTRPEHSHDKIMFLLELKKAFLKVEFHFWL